jgi:hypothetical protein
MRVFLSHVSTDHPLAIYLSSAFSSVGVETFMLPEHAAPGTSWMEAIRHGLHECEEAVSLITPEALTRPWIAAEWACFWLQEKHCTALLGGAKVNDLWRPMSTFQAVDLLEPARLSPLLNRWAESTRVLPTPGVIPLANEVAREAEAILARQRLENLDAVLTRVASNLPSGTDNIRREDVVRLVEADRVTDLVDLALGDSVANVKRKQVAQSLVFAGRLGEALLLAEAIDNRNEAKNVALTVVDEMPRVALEESEEWQFLLGIFPYLGKPQRRDVLNRLTQRGITPLGAWHQYMDGEAPDSN